MFNTLKPLTTVSERIAKKEDQCEKVIYFELFGDICIKMITTGQTFLSNYELSRFSKEKKQVNLYEFFSLGM
jgi:hypothetical protein